MTYAQLLCQGICCGNYRVQFAMCSVVGGDECRRQPARVALQYVPCPAGHLFLHPCPAHSPGVRLCAVEAAHRSIFDQVDLPNYPTLACHLSDACHTRSARGQMKSALAWQPAGAHLPCRAIALSQKSEAENCSRGDQLLSAKFSA